MPQKSSGESSISSYDPLDSNILLFRSLLRSIAAVQHDAMQIHQGTKPDVPRRLALSNFEHLVSLSSEHTDRQTVENTVWIAL